MRRISVLMICLWIVGNPEQLNGQNSPASNADANVLATFSVARHGDLLLLPLSIEGKVYSFLVDTGATKTVLDSKVPRGRYLRKTSVTAAQGEVLYCDVYEPPPAQIGALPFDIPTGVLVFDLTAIRRVTGAQIHGVIGMDYLKRHVIQIDFYRGELSFLTRPPSHSETVFELTFDANSLPNLSLHISDIKDVPFAIDTGNASFDSGSLSFDTFNGLESRKQLRVVGTSLSETLSGTATSRIGIAGKLSIGSFEVSRPVFDESGDNRVGLHFLSRFDVTFDFPNDKLYLNKGRDYERADVWNITGLHIIPKDGRFLVESVDNDSPASSAGVMANDVIMRVGDEDTSNISAWEFRRRCCEPGMLSLTLQRPNGVINVQLAMKR